MLKIVFGQRIKSKNNIVTIYGRYFPSWHRNFCGTAARMARVISFCVAFCFAKICSCQSIDIKWSEKFQYDNKLDGFFDSYLGTNQRYIYAKFSNIGREAGNQKIKLIAFDKYTMERAGDVRLKGYGRDKEKDALTYYKTIVLDSLLYVIWTREQNGVVDIFAETFDTKLRELQPIKKIYEVAVSRKSTDNLVIVFNRNIGDKILMGKELAVITDGENLRFEYKIINEDFSIAKEGQVILPIKVARRRRQDDSFTSPVCTYELADDGNIYAQNMVRVTGDERKSLKKGEANTYPVIIQINPETREVSDYPVKFPRKNTFSYSSLISKRGIRLYGFFCDLDKDPKGSDTHGTFYITIDSKSFVLTSHKFSYFDKPFLEELYAADQENRRKGGGIFRSGSDVDSDRESIDDNYIIEKAVEDGGDMLLFCSIMRNWTETRCSGGGYYGGQSCRTYYYCTKSNVTVFRLDSAGQITWAKNLDRAITYTRWNVYDLNVMSRNGNYYVVYGSAYQILARKKNNATKKSSQQMADRMEYAVFNAHTGDFTRAEYQVNKLNVRKENAKYVDPDDVEVFDNRMYTECNRIKLKPAVWLSCLFPPAFYFISISGNSRHGTGYLGRISPGD